MQDVQKTEMDYGSHHFWNRFCSDFIYSIYIKAIMTHEYKL